MHMHMHAGTALAHATALTSLSLNVSDGNRECDMFTSGGLVSLLQLGRLRSLSLSYRRIRVRSSDILVTLNV